MCKGLCEKKKYRIEMKVEHRIEMKVEIKYRCSANKLNIVNPLTDINF